jgi:hypothetical protein
MRQFWCLVGHETATQILHWRSLTLAGTAVALAMLITGLGVRDYRFRLERFEARVHQREVDRSKDKGRLWGYVAEPALRVLRAPSQTAVMVRALDTAMPSYWDFGPAGVIEGPTDTSMTLDSEGGTALDAEALMRLLFGLAAILLGIDAIAGEYLSGTLMALLNQPIGRITIVAGKFIGAAASLVVWVGLTVGAVGLVLWLNGPRGSAGEYAWPLLAFAAMSIVYLSTMLAVGIFVGALLRSYRAALLAGLAIWTYIAVLAPQVAVFVSRMTVPAFNRTVVETEMQSLYDARLRMISAVMGRALNESLADNPIPVTGDIQPPIKAQIDQLWKADAAETRAMLDAAEREPADAMTTQHRVMSWLEWTNPGTTFIHVAADIAGTGRAGRQRWMQAVHEYDRYLDATLFDDRPRIGLLVPSGAGEMKVSLDRHLPLTSRDLAAFRPPAPALSRRIVESGWDFVVAAGYLALAVLGAGWAFARARF